MERNTRRLCFGATVKKVEAERAKSKRLHLLNYLRKASYYYIFDVCFFWIGRAHANWTFRRGLLRQNTCCESWSLKRLNMEGRCGGIVVMSFGTGSRS